MSQAFDDDTSAVESDQALDTGARIEDLYAAMERAREEQFEAYRAYAGSERYAKHLRSAFESFADAPDLTVGGLVQWKTFLRNAEFPDYGAPAIVMEFREDLPASEKQTIDRQDVVLGVLDHEQDLRLILTDRRRLMTWAPEEAG
ncbi:hypothetical protein [Microbacterium esteraromaticum]|uniref:hypothetical protein n=1 Tax=Microbacterium esteraromaticum TaxID=57043 RepID=UPI00195EE862|nr:hypothetical protein [Microbacterium esteraromaticum]MBM7466110.1 hypothetical protein [Microbacterium esteraromaticum]